MDLSAEAVGEYEIEYRANRTIHKMKYVPVTIVPSDKEQTDQTACS